MSSPKLPRFSGKTVVRSSTASTVIVNDLVVVLTGEPLSVAVTSKVADPDWFRAGVKVNTPPALKAGAAENRLDGGDVITMVKVTV